MKKKYSLNYNIERDIDRMEAVKEILNTLPTNPSPAELEQMASYVLYGKDENGKNAVQRGDVIDSDKRYKSFQKAADKVQSLDEILENPLNNQQNLQPFNQRNIYTNKKQTIKRPRRDKKTGEIIDRGDMDIPGMQELWSCIDHLEHTYLANKGEIPFNDDDSVLRDDYRIYQLQHLLIDVRRHQYYLKDAYKPTIHFLAIQQPAPQTYNFDADTFYWIPYEEWEKRVSAALLHTISKNIEDYETREINGKKEVKWVVRHQTFDWENPKHIYALINHYSAIYMQTYDKFNSWGRTLIYDFDRYYDMCHFSPVREFILTCRIDHLSYSKILPLLQEKFGIKYNENHLSNIVSKEIPEKMAKEAKKHRLLLTVPMEERKKCYKCKRLFPRDNLFFSVNRSRKDGLSSNCKECERQQRIVKGGQSENDRRNKDTQVLEMPARETNF